MTTVILANTLQARDARPPAVSLKDDGTFFPWRMFFDGNRRVADTDNISEALEVIIPGYLASDDKFSERVRLAETVQMAARSAIATRLTDAQVQNLEEWEWNVLTYDGTPYGWGDGSLPVGTEQSDESVDVWKSDIPLVLLTSSYAPHTTILKPLSIEGDYEEVKNLIWLRPEEEFEFLQTLSRIGFITFGVPSAVDVYAR